MINVGFNNYVAEGKIVAMAGCPEPRRSLSAPIKKQVWQARQDGQLIDCTNGRRTRSVIVTDRGHVVLSSVEPKTLATRICEAR